MTPRAASGDWDTLGRPSPRVPRSIRQQAEAYERTNFLYLIRVGMSASGPFRRFKSSMYAP